MGYALLFAFTIIVYASVAERFGANMPTLNSNFDITSDCVWFVEWKNRWNCDFRIRATCPH